MVATAELAANGQGLSVLCPGVEVDESTITIDIVAVPGLGADPKRSFGSETGRGFNWLSDERDGIRSDIPGARVLLYEYDSRWFGQDALPQTLFNAASLLLDSLVAKRERCKTRPLVFLPHSMGGLVVAKALTLAASRPEEIDRLRIYECFAGGVFFGTPFRGSSEAGKALLFASVLEAFDKGVPSQMIRVLDPDLDALSELRNEFTRLVTKEPKANIACIYEQKETSYVNLKIGRKLKVHGIHEIVVTQDSAKLDCAEEVRGMACDHRQLNRFDSVKDGRFESVRQLLRGIVTKARIVVKRRLNASRHSAIDDATFTRLSNTLNVADYHRKRRKVESVSGDSSWILKEPKYVQWSAIGDADDEEQDRSSCLWVSGTEGQGKSKAALAALEKLEEVEYKNGTPGAKDALVAYFFCDSAPDYSSAENLLKSLMWQLILKRRPLAQYVKGFAAQDMSRSSTASGSFSLAKLWRGLQDMLRDPSVQNVYFIVNNLHYLSDGSEEFFDLINSEVLGETTGGEDPVREKVKWMFLSRARENIKEAMNGGSAPGVLRVDLEDGSKDAQLRLSLKAYTRDRVKALAHHQGYSLSLQYFVTSILQQRAENNTLWVEVVCRLLEGLPSSHVQVRKTLEAIPQDLEELIKRTWSEALNSSTEGIDTTKEILRTLAIAYEDPTIDELKVIAELNDQTGAQQVREQIRACGPLLRIYDSDDGYGDLGSMRVTFVHPLAKDSLLKSSRKLIGLSDDDEDRIEVRWQHGIVALRCLAYTFGQLEPTENHADWEESDPESGEKDEMERQLDELFPEEVQVVDEEVSALEYPLAYWLRHGNESTPDFVDTLDLKHAFWAMDSSVRRRWWTAYASRDGLDELTGLTAMHVAAFFGLTTLVDPLVATGHASEIRARDSWDNQPLHWAAERGHVETMEKLLSLGADIHDGLQDNTWTPLHMAASAGQVEAIKFLLDGDHQTADVNAVSKEVGTPFTLAVCFNQKAAAELLLSKGASPTLTSDDFDSPVAVAALGGYDDLVAALLAAGGHQNMISKEYGSALAAAASAGHLGIVETLMRFDKNPASHQRALEEASQNNFYLIVKLLLQNYTGLKCDKAFEVAASQGHNAVVQELWNHHRQHNALTQTAVNNALYMATDGEQEATVYLLLRHCGANPNATGEEYGNAVTAAAYDGNMAILKMLVSARADLNATSGYPLQAAASQGYEDVVGFLLQCGASANGHTDKHLDGTPLQAACVAGNSAVAKTLLGAGADPDRGGGDFTNPLTAATSQGHGDLLELLLEKGANPNVTGGADGTTPLINASATLAADRLEALIRHGARVDTQDPDGDTALILSALFADDACVEVLLRHGADINICGKHYGTALHAAAHRGHVDTCRLLLQHGANPSVRGGPHDTVIQAAAISGSRECLELVLNGHEHGKSGIRGQLRSWQSNGDRDLGLNAQGGEHFTALHAAAAEPDDGCLRLLLQRSPEVNTVPQGNTKAGTALQAAAFAGCSRNARLLLEAGADPNIVAGKHGTALQAAALKCGPEICRLLLERGARVDGAASRSGKYGNALVAAVVRDYHEGGDVSMLELLLEEREGEEGASEFPPEAYLAALEKAFTLRRKDAFRLIWRSVLARERTKKKGSPVNVRQLLARFRAQLRRQKVISTDEEDANSDFGDDVEHYYQGIEDEFEEETEEEPEAQTVVNANGNASRAFEPGTTNGTRGFADTIGGDGSGNQDGTDAGIKLIGNAIGSIMGKDENESTRAMEPSVNGGATGYREDFGGPQEYQANGVQRSLTGEPELESQVPQDGPQEDLEEGPEGDPEEPEEEPEEPEAEPEEEAEEKPEQGLEEDQEEPEEEPQEPEEPEEEPVEEPQEEEEPEEQSGSGWAGRASRWMDRF